MTSREQQKRNRLQILKRILREAHVRDQAHLQELLQREGIVVTQTTVSRDLADLGVVRAREGRGYRYRLGGELCAGASEEQLERWRDLMAHFVLSIAVAGNQVVLRTSPGQANGVASFLDNMNQEDVLGTIAGDDTILVIARDARSGRQIAGDLQKLLEGGRGGF